MSTPKTTCPVCKAPMPAPWREYPEYPFCGKRCKTIDLGRWLSEDYRVPEKDGENRSSEVRDNEE